MSNNIEKKLNVGILTYHRAINYGAFLQACALCSRLNSLGFVDAELIDYRTLKERAFYDPENIPFQTKILRRRKYYMKKELITAFERGYQDSRFRVSKERCVSDNIEDFQNFVKSKYDVIVAGSDEIWKTNSYRSFPTAYWLSGDLGCRKLSYAASARVDLAKMKPEDVRYIVEALSDFEYIGVRDTMTQNAVQNILNGQKPVYMNCDPSFLDQFPIVKTQLGEKEILRGKLDKNKKNAVVMIGERKPAKYIRKKLGDQYNLISVYDYQEGYINPGDLSPFEWLEVLGNADFVIASYFHAVCFSIIYHVPFLAWGNPSKNSKLEGLLSGSGLERHFVRTPEEFWQKNDLLSYMESLKTGSDFAGFVAEQQKGFSTFGKKLEEIARDLNKR